MRGRHEAQRLEGAGSFRFVLQQKRVDIELVEDFFGDRIVAALGVPLAAIIAAAQVNRNDWVSAALAGPFNAGVVHANRFVQCLLGIDAHFLLNVAAPFGIEVVTVARSVDLDVTHAFARQSLHLRSENGRDVPQEFRIGRIRRGAEFLFVHDGGELVRRRQSNFDVAGGVFFQEIRFVRCETPLLSDLAYDDSREPVVQARNGRLALELPIPGDGFGIVKTVYRFVEVAHEAEAAELAIGEDAQADVLLALDHALDMAIFQRTQFFRRCCRIPASLH